MDWQHILNKLRQIKEPFDRSYKCLNTDRFTKDETIDKHIDILLNSFEQIRVLLNVNYSRLTQAHKTAANKFFDDLKNKLVNIFVRKNLKIELPLTLHEQSSYGSVDYVSKFKMSQSVTEFLGLASKLLPDFDGKPENLPSFIDALNLVDTIKDTHNTVAVNLVRTKLKGTARNLITNETTLQEIINRLKTSVKGESVDVLSAKLMNIKQSGKNANAYAKEIEDLTKALEGAYISDGLPTDIASKYSTQSAVKAIVKNAQNDRVKLVIESGNFSNMNDLLAKFISSCTETYGQSNHLLFYNTNREAHNWNRNRGRGYKKNRGYNNLNRYNNNRGRSNNHSGRRGYNAYNNNSRTNNVRLITDEDSGNGQQPLILTQ